MSEAVDRWQMLKEQDGLYVSGLEKTGEITGPEGKYLKYLFEIRRGISGSIKDLQSTKDNQPAAENLRRSAGGDPGLLEDANARLDMWAHGDREVGIVGLEEQLGKLSTRTMELAMGVVLNSGDPMVDLAGMIPRIPVLMKIASDRVPLTFEQASSRFVIAQEEKS